MSKIPYVSCGVFHNYISCGVVGICVVVCLSNADRLFMFLNGVTKSRKTWNYKQGWGTPSLSVVQSTHNPKTLTFLCLFLFSV